MLIQLGTRPLCDLDGPRIRFFFFLFSEAFLFLFLLLLLTKKGSLHYTGRKPLQFQAYVVEVINLCILTASQSVASL